jgi:dynein heavy chain
MEPKLQQMKEENTRLLIQLQKNEKEANVKREACERDEAECNKVKEEADRIRTDCQEELNKVVPILDSAAKLLEKVDKKQIDELKSFANPSAAARLVVEAVCYVFEEDKDVKWIAKPDGKPGEKIQDFWDYSKKKLLNDKLLGRVKSFRENNISAMKKIDKLKKLI